MNATEEWLRYIESKAIKQRYNITKYSSENDSETHVSKSTEGTHNDIQHHAE